MRTSSTPHPPPSAPGAPVHATPPVTRLVLAGDVLGALAGLRWAAARFAALPGHAARVVAFALLAANAVVLCEVGGWFLGGPLLRGRSTRWTAAQQRRVAVSIALAMAFWATGPLVVWMLSGLEGSAAAHADAAASLTPVVRGMLLGASGVGALIGIHRRRAAQAEARSSRGGEERTAVT